MDGNDVVKVKLAHTRQSHVYVTIMHCHKMMVHKRLKLEKIKIYNVF